MTLTKMLLLIVILLCVADIALLCVADIALLCVADIALRILHRRSQIAPPSVVAQQVQVAADINAQAEADWRTEMAKYPEGSPRHTAYLNRLKSIGADVGN